VAVSKFPILNIYRTLFNIGAVLVILVGVLTAVGDIRAPGGSFNLGTFVAAFVPFLAVSAVLGFLAESIKLALVIERHLDRIANK
jgi:hypothetical protein